MEYHRYHTSSWCHPPSPPSGEPLLLPGMCSSVSPRHPFQIKTKLLGRRVEAHLAHPPAAHLGVAQRHLQGEPVHERGEVRREAVGVARAELAGPLPLHHYLSDGVAPAPVERL